MTLTESWHSNLNSFRETIMAREDEQQTRIRDLTVRKPLENCIADSAEPD